MKITIAGGTSHIARALLPYLAAEGDSITLFARRPEKLPAGDFRVESDFSRLPHTRCDLLINCIGAGTPDIVRDDPTLWFSVLEKFDDLALQTLQESSPGALYVHFSSGAVYDRQSGAFAAAGDRRTFAPNHLQSADYYSIAQLYSEAKHRAHRGLRIVDLRIFSFFSRYARLDSGYFMTDLVRALAAKTPFATSRGELIRDYPHPADLAALIRGCSRVPEINTALDVRSLAPVGKQEILDRFADRFSLEYFYSDDIAASPNGDTNIYAPAASGHAAELCGVTPQWSSIDTLLTETDALLSGLRAE